MRSEISEIFSWPVRVYYEDTDAQGVVYYANYFRFLERARTEWLRALGVDQEKMLAHDRLMFVVASLQADFVTAAKFDDRLFVTAALANLTRASFEIRQEIHREDPDGELILKGSVKAALIDADSHRPQRIPATLFEGIQS